MIDTVLINYKDLLKGRESIFGQSSDASAAATTATLKMIKSYYRFTSKNADWTLEKSLNSAALVGQEHGYRVWNSQAYVSSSFERLVRLQENFNRFPDDIKKTFLESFRDEMKRIFEGRI